MSEYTQAPPADRELLEFAVGVACRAGNLAAERFFVDDRHTTLKPDGTEVTDADLAVEQQIRDELGRFAPDDEVYGEEIDTTPGTSGRRWVIDPIDGTYYFVRRVPLFNTRLAYEDEHGPAIGVINHPAAQEIVFAGRGLGCWRLTGTRPDLAAAHPARVSDRTQLNGAAVSTGNPGAWPEDLLLALRRQAFLAPAGGTIGLATGRVDAYVIAGYPMGYEDLAPMPVIIHEAGGHATDLGGNPLLTGDGTVLATNDHLHEPLLALTADLARTSTRTADRLQM